jgi:hypothetical protein
MTSECSPAGTWYGGSSGAKYHYNFVPGEAGRFFLTAEGAYSPDLLGAALLTTFTGELEKKSDENYEIRVMALSRKDPTDSEELPVIVAGIGDVQLEGCDKMTITYNFGAFYEWGKVPFVDEPLSMFITEDNPGVETLDRMLMGTQLP